MQTKDVISGLVSGFSSGFLVTAVGGRIIMRIIAIVDPFTHPLFTAGGALFLAFSGVAFGAMLGAPWGLTYVAVRGFLPGASFAKGLLFGLLLLVVSGGVFFSMDQAEEFSDFSPTLIGVGLFALMFPIFGLLVSLQVDRIHRRISAITEKRQKVVAAIVFGVIILTGLLTTVGTISEAF